MRCSGTMVISVDEEDKKGVLYPHNDVLVVTMLVTNFTTQRILIDNCNSGEILFWDALTNMGVVSSRLHLVLMPLKGFLGM